jgi:hypothetical protein
MARQFIRKLKLVSVLLEQINIVLPRYGKRLAVGGEGVVRNGMVEEVVHFRGRHSNRIVAIGGALYYCFEWSIGDGEVWC